MLYPPQVGDPVGGALDCSIAKISTNWLETFGEDICNLFLGRHMMNLDSSSGNAVMNEKIVNLDVFYEHGKFGCW